MAGKVDSNVSGLRFAEETSAKTLPVTPTWYALDRNEDNDIGGEITTVARSPISDTRSEQKGVVTDLTAGVGFGIDFTPTNIYRLMQGAFFADVREKKTTAPMNSAATAITSATASTKTYAAASGLTGFAANSLVVASGFTNSTNNGLKTVASTSTATAIVTVEALADEAAPPAAAKLELIGRAFASGDLTITIVGAETRINSTAVDLTTLGLIAGEWLFVGGDTTATQFASGKGFVRVASVVAGYIVIDQAAWTAVADTGAGKTIQIFFGSVLQNESTTNLIKTRYYQFERTLGNDDVGTMSEYISGAVANEFALTIPSAEKVTASMGFVALDHEARTGTEGLKTGTRPTFVSEAAFNTSSNFPRVKIALLGTTVNPTPLVGCATDISLTITNGVTPLKCIGTLGGFENTISNFVVTGDMTAYFSDAAAIDAVRNNSDVTMSIAMVNKNTGWLFDLPLVSLGGGKANVSKDEAVMLPLEIMAAQGKFGATLLANRFAYLPSVAQ